MLPIKNLSYEYRFNSSCRWEIQTPKIAIVVILVLMVLPLQAYGVENSFENIIRKVPASEIRANIANSTPVDYDRVVIMDDLDLNNLGLSKKNIERRLFWEEFREPFSLSDTVKIVRSPINITNSTIDGQIDFRNAIFENSTNFRGTRFNRSASFSGSRFNNSAEFGFSTFNNSTDFVFTQFSNSADFGFSQFNNSAEFELSNFDGPANFMSSKFYGDASFVLSSFNRPAYFSSSVFNRTVDFSLSKFNSNAFFSSTSFRDKLNLRGMEYDKLYLRWNEKINLVYDDSSYQLLISNFKKLGFMSDADNCYYQFRVEQFKHKDLIEDPFMHIIDFGAMIFYGYSKKPLFPLLWSIGTIFFFGAIWWIGGFRSDNYLNQTGIFERYSSNEAKAPTNRPSSQDKWNVQILVEVMLFSATIFLSGTRLFIDPPAIPLLKGRVAPLVRLVFIAERALGAFFSILFFLAIGATVVR